MIYTTYVIKVVPIFTKISPYINLSFNGKSELSDDEVLQNTPPYIEDEAKAATLNMLPKS